MKITSNANRPHSAIGRLSPLLIAVVGILTALMATGCDDDLPKPRSERELIGIWSDSDTEYMEIEDTDYIYQYNLQEFEGESYWIKRKLTYFFEPVSDLILRQDIEGLLQVYKVVSNKDDKLTLCWVDTPMQENVTGDNKLEIIQIFFKPDYELNPADFRTYRKLTKEELEKGLGDIEVIEAY